VSSDFQVHQPSRVRAAFVRCASLALIAALILSAVQPAIALPAGPETLSGPVNQAGDIAGQRLTMSAGITETTAQIMERQARLAGQPPEPLVARPDRANLTRKMATSSLEQGPVSGPTLPQSPAAAFTLGTSFDGPDSTVNLCGTPPDTMGAIGPTQFIVLVNCNIVSYNKATGVADGVLSTTPNNFFQTVRSSSTTDPHIRYDRLTRRWFLFIIDVTFPNNRVLIAYSDSATITAGTTWTFRYFQSAFGTHTSCLADYPTPGIDYNAIYIGVNQFCGTSLNTATYAGSDGYVLSKSAVLGGSGAVTITAFNLATTADGPYTPQGVDNPDPAATEGYFIGVSVQFPNELDLIRVSNPGGTPTISGIVPVTTANQGYPATQPHLGNTGGTNGYLDASDNRLFAAYFRNGSLWTAMDVGVDNSCAGVSVGSASRDAVFWWEIRGIPTGQTPSLYQSGSVCDTTTTNPAFYSYGTIMVNGQGHAALGYTIAGANNYTEPGYSVRLAGDSLGTLPTSYISPPGTHPYNPSFDSGAINGFRRWGDYSYTSLDPCDDMTLWTIQEYASQDNQYGERVTQLIAPPPATPASANPAAVAAGQASITVTITGTTASGSGFYDTPSSMSAETCRKRITATVTSGVTVSSITYTDPTHVTLNISTVGATPGLKTVTVTNPDGQSASAAILQVANALTPTTTSLASAPNPSVFGQSVTFTATVSGSGGTPTGSVSFYDSGASLGSGALSGGVATYGTAALAVGTHTITATYNGDSTFASSASTPLSQAVNKANTTTAIISAPNPSVFGQSVTLTATVSVSAPGAGTPTGSATFYSDGAPLLNSALVGSVATYITDTWFVGTHIITATFTGDSNFVESRSSSLVLTVNGYQVFLPITFK